MRGVRRRLTAGQAARIVGAIASASAVDAARRELAAELVEDLRRIDARMRDTSNKLTAASGPAGPV